MKDESATTVNFIREQWNLLIFRSPPVVKILKPKNIKKACSCIVCFLWLEWLDVLLYDRWRLASSVLSWSTVTGRWGRVVRAATGASDWGTPTTAPSPRNRYLRRNAWRRSRPPRARMDTPWPWPPGERCTAGGMVGGVHTYVSFMSCYSSHL